MLSNFFLTVLFMGLGTEPEPEPRNHNLSKVGTGTVKIVTVLQYCLNPQERGLYRVYHCTVRTLNGADAFGFPSFLPLPTVTMAVFGSYLSSLYCSPKQFRRCGFAYPYDWGGFVGPKKKTSDGHLCMIHSVWSSCRHVLRLKQG
jgi:hypothetical protein